MKFGRIRLYTCAAGAALVLASCGTDGTFEPDLRGLMRGGLNTAGAAAGAQPRPAPDSRGLITYPDYQVAIAQQDDTVTKMATRLGLNAGQLAQYNAIDPNATLNAGALIALPSKVAPGTPAAGGRAITSTTGQVSDPFAGQGVSRAGAASSAPAASSGAQPRQHQVASGETAWSIARKYGVSVNDLAKWNGLPSDMTIRVGQRLLIPVQGQSPSGAARTVSAPGVGSATPQPPSAANPLPDEKTQPAAEPVAKPSTPDLGATRTTASDSGRFQMPVPGSIIRTYQKGRNEGIDISAQQGAAVNASGAGVVAAITRDTDGVPIVVIRHSGDLMTVYAGLTNLQVSKGQSVTQGQALGVVSDAGIVHFEVRQGFESVDPEKYLN